MNATFQWIHDHIKDEIDFVVWTGDSARHDNDERIPRTEKQIVSLNNLMVDKFVEVFGKDDNLDDPDPTNDFVVPIVPTFGNNDMMPHNIFEPGPNRWTRDFAEIWEKFIPEAQRHSFARGGWFFTEVIPNKLAVVSLNTMYFFKSNAAVDGCDAKSEPGYEHMDWLRVQLQFLRERGMKAILIGHVPPARVPSKKNWEESCWQKYSLWMREYRDVVVTGMFGHMNTDHFLFQDSRELKYRTDAEELEITEEEDVASSDPIYSIQSRTEYLIDLRDSWSELPVPPAGASYAHAHSHADTSTRSRERKKKMEKKKKRFLKEIGGEWAERYSLSLISPSVVPKYFPSLRVVEYNISGLEDSQPGAGQSLPASERTELERDAGQRESILGDEAELPSQILKKGRKKKGKKSKKKHKKPKQPSFTKPRPPPASAPPGPGYSPQPLSLVSYTQYFANLTFLNHEFKQSGLSLEEYIGVAANHSHDDTARVAEYSQPQAQPRFQYHVEYNTRTDRDYKMADLTVGSYLDLAYRIVSNLEKQGPNVYDPMLGGVAGGSTGEISFDAIENADRANVSEDTSSQMVSNERTHIIEEFKKKKKHKKKKHRKHRKHHKHTKWEELWHTFIKRAFVMTKDDSDMDDFE